MLCANCKSVSKFPDRNDRFLCEFNHILCQTCMCSTIGCPICGKSVFKITPINESGSVPSQENEFEKTDENLALQTFLDTQIIDNSNGPRNLTSLNLKQDANVNHNVGMASSSMMSIKVSPSFHEKELRAQIREQIFAPFLEKKSLKFNGFIATTNKFEHSSKRASEIKNICEEMYESTRSAIPEKEDLSKAFACHQKCDSLCNLHISIDGSASDSEISTNDEASLKSCPEKKVHGSVVPNEIYNISIDGRNGKLAVNLSEQCTAVANPLTTNQNLYILENCHISIFANTGKLTIASIDDGPPLDFSTFSNENCHISVNSSNGLMQISSIDRSSQTSSAKTAISSIDVNSRLPIDSELLQHQINVHRDNSREDVKRMHPKNGAPKITDSRIIACRPCTSKFLLKISESEALFMPLDVHPIAAVPLKIRQNSNIRSACEVIRDRSPFSCPITACRNKPILVSDFAYHLHVDHQKLPFQTIGPGMFRNVYVDPKNIRSGLNMCCMGFLVKNKIKDLGCRLFKDFLPILVMTTKVNLLELIRNDKVGAKEDLTLTNELLLIWVTGLCPMEEEMEIFCTLTAWSKVGANIQRPAVHIVHSMKLYSVRNRQDPQSLYESGSVMVLTQEQCHKLTNNGGKNIQLQVAIH